MAQDDVTIVITANLGIGSSVNRQPGSNVEEVLLSVGLIVLEGSAPNAVPAVTIRRIDGTNDEAVILDGNAGNMANAWHNMKIMADNTRYFNFTNNSGNQGDLSHSMMVVG